MTTNNIVVDIIYPPAGQLVTEKFLQEQIDKAATRLNVDLVGMDEKPTPTICNGILFEGS